MVLTSHAGQRQDICLDPDYDRMHSREEGEGAGGDEGARGVGAEAKGGVEVKEEAGVTGEATIFVQTWFYCDG